MVRLKVFVPSERIEKSILLLRGQRVMLDSDLAVLYRVTTRRLNEQVKRNRDRFPEDFMFQLSQKELNGLRSQFATSRGWGGRRYLPFVFTEHGTVMLASVLSSPLAVRVNIQIVRAFIRLRELSLSHRYLSQRLNDLEKKYDRRFLVVFDAIRKLMSPTPESKSNSIGFRSR